MPCNAQAVRYRPDAGGTVFYSPDGHAEKGIECTDPAQRLRIGYRPHWASCPAGKPGFRKWNAKAAREPRKGKQPEPGAGVRQEYEQLALFEYY